MAHPVHPALVHFPIACWSLATIGDIASLQLGAQVWHGASTLLALGLVTGLAAMLAGLIELGKIDDASPAMLVANWHMRLVVMAWSLYALSLFLRLQGSRFIQPGGAAIGLSALGFFALCIGGWLGAQLVYGHGIGVNQEHPTPPATRPDSPS